MPSVTSGTVCVFGAGGPVGAVAAEALAPHYNLRLADSLTIDEILCASLPAQGLSASAKA